jgi:PTH1 family peptidyl-tRNA hydrolase
MWLVVGLGNPGTEYEDTRHNAGYLVVDEVARRWRLPAGRARLGASAARGRVGHGQAVLAKPQRYMNRSGGPVAALQSLESIPVERVVIVHDDLDLDFGTVRIKLGGGHGGHNGLRDLHEHIGSEFLRIRVGISRPPSGLDTADYVLGAWGDTERQGLPSVIERAADAVEAVLAEGVIRAMNAFNVRPRRRKAEDTDSTRTDEAGASTPAKAGCDESDGPSQSSAPDGARS